MSTKIVKKSEDLIKHLDPEQNFDSDCFDSVYNTVHPALKQAWEEGKIELKDIQNE